MKFSISFFPLFILMFSGKLFAQQGQSVYQSETLQIQQLSPHVFVHVSYLQSGEFGKVACNGMVVIDGGEALVFDTPADDPGSKELIDWLEKEKKVQVKGLVATHFHDDCVGGLGEFHARKIPSYASFKTIELAKAEGNQVPQNGFEGQLSLQAGDIKILNQFFGEGHTKDNVVTFVSSDQVLFGGCMIKELNATKGYLGDANLTAWPETVKKVKAAFPLVQFVIPGHGKTGDSSLLDYTIRLFSPKESN